MLFWIILALVTAAVVLVVIAPLMRPVEATAGETAEDADVYRDQLKELERDRERGLIGDSEAEAARAEIGRRLLAATAAAVPELKVRSVADRRIAMATVIAIPALAVPLYLTLGQPDMPDAPLVERLAAAPAAEDVAALVGRVEKHLATKPDDIEGWRVIAPIYARMGRLEDAVAAWGRIVAAGAADNDILESYGVGLVDTNDGIVSPQAQAVLAKVVAADASRIRAKFYYAEGLRQAGSLKAALDEFDDLIRRSPANAPWLKLVRDRRHDTLVALNLPADTPEPATLPAVAEAPGPTEADVDAAAGMDAGDRKTMIEGMVQQLATKLDSDPRDRNGWVRLMRSYSVLGRADDARAALARARETFAADKADLDAINAAAASLGIGN